MSGESPANVPPGNYVVAPAAQIAKARDLKAKIDARLGYPKVCATCGQTHSATWDDILLSPDGTQIAYRILPAIVSHWQALQAAFPSTIGKLPDPAPLDATWAGATVVQ